MTDKQKWEKIIKFLDDEQKLKEQLILFDKSSSMNDENIRPKNDKGQKGLFENSQTNKTYVASSNSKKSVICQK